MREVSRSDDDIAIDAAREKLATLRTRPGFEQAMAPEPTGATRDRRIAIGLLLLFVALAVASFSQVSTTWLRIVLVLLFVAFAMFAGLAAIGFSTERQAETGPAVVMAKTVDAHKDQRWITLLDDRGETRDLLVLENVWELLRAGDVGVAHVRPGESPLLIEFHRL